VSAAPDASRLAEKRRLLEGLSSSSKRVPHPVVSTWGLANLEISVPIGSFPVDGAEEPSSTAGSTLSSGAWLPTSAARWVDWA
jgi:hypothetical protein